MICVWLTSLSTLRTIISKSIHIAVNVIYSFMTEAIVFANTVLDR